MAAAVCEQKKKNQLHPAYSLNFYLFREVVFCPFVTRSKLCQKTRICPLLNVLFNVMSMAPPVTICVYIYANLPHHKLSTKPGTRARNICCCGQHHLVILCALSIYRVARSIILDKMPSEELSRMASSSAYKVHSSTPQNMPEFSASMRS